MTPGSYGLTAENARLFDWGEWDDEWRRIQRAVIDQLAVGIATETFAEVLSWVE